MVNSKWEEDREIAAELLGEDFLDLPNRIQACEDLHKLTLDKDSFVRLYTVSSVAINFAHVHNKEGIWIDLHRLSFDLDILVKFNVASAMEAVFHHLNEKERKQALEDLYRLRIAEEHRDVRKAANYSLGKLSVYKASEAENEDDYKRELETAIQFFEKSSEASTSFTFLNPANFCLPFYRSFYSIVFNKQSEMEDIEKYLSEAKNAIEESKNKKLLFEAIGNLSNALKEVQNLDFEDKKEKLNSCRKYCGIAVEIMKNTEKTAPYATELIRKGLPILDRKLKSLLEEIQEKAKTACRESQGTDTAEIACAVSREVQKWEIGSQEYLAPQIESLVFMFKSYIPNIEENSLILNRVDQILNEQDIVKQYTLLNNLIPQIIDIQVSEKTTPILDGINYLRVSVDRLIESVDELQNPQEYLDTIQLNLEELKNEIPEMKGKIDEVLYELYSPLSTTQKLKVAIPIIPLLATYELETDIPKLVTDKIYELKNLILRSKNK